MGPWPDAWTTSTSVSTTKQQLYSESSVSPANPQKKPIIAACVGGLLRSAVTHHSRPQARAGTKTNQYMRSLPLQITFLLCPNSAVKQRQNCTCCSCFNWSHISPLPNLRTSPQLDFTHRHALESSPTCNLSLGKVLLAKLLWCLNNFSDGCGVAALFHWSGQNPVSSSQREHLQVITVISLWNVLTAQPKSQPGSLIRHERCFSLGIFLKCRTDRMFSTFIYLIRCFRHMESFHLDLRKCCLTEPTCSAAGFTKVLMEFTQYRD